MKTTTSLLALALALASPAAFAHSGDDASEQNKMKMPMEQTPEQSKMMADKMWADMDTNKNGSITRAEFDYHVARMMAMGAHMHDGMYKDAAGDCAEDASHAAHEATEDSTKAAHEAAEDSTKAAHEAAEAKADAAEAAAKHK